jgi:hypothetical protein
MRSEQMPQDLCPSLQSIEPGRAIREISEGKLEDPLEILRVAIGGQTTTTSKELLVQRNFPVALLPSPLAAAEAVQLNKWRAIHYHRAMRIDQERARWGSTKPRVPQKTLHARLHRPSRLLFRYIFEIPPYHQGTS